MKKTQKSYRQESGFTLFEILIVVAIIGILASIAYPMYSEQVRETRRGDAQGALLAFANAMERHYTENGTYNAGMGTVNATLTAPPATLFASEAPLDGSEKFYDLRFFRLSPTFYEIRAIAKGAQTRDGNLRLTSTGQRQHDANGDGTFEATW